MKKTLLLIMAVALCTSLMAQQHKVNSAQIQSVPFNKSIYRMGAGLDTDVIPAVRSSIMLSRGAVTAIGETYYNLPTNAFARNTISFRPNTKNLAAVWTMAELSPDRGTGINYYNEGDWNPIPDPKERIESMRTGWGTHAFTNEGEIVVAHDGSTGIVVNTREKWGEGEWTEYIIKGPEYKLCATVATCTNPITTTALLWPTMASNGDTIHMVCVTDQWPAGTQYKPYPRPEGQPPFGYMGYSTVPLYYRSCDGGKTWDIKEHNFMAEGMTSYEVCMTSGDNYVIAVKGSHVVLGYSDYMGFCNYMESRDSGVNWEKKTIYDNGDIYLEGDFMSERLMPQMATIAIGDDGRVHAAFASQSVHKNSEGGWYRPILPIGLIYWNDSWDPITSEDVKAWGDPANGTYDYNWDSYKGYIELPSVLGYDYWYSWPKNPPHNNDQFRDSGFALFPRIIAKDGKVYLTFQSHLEYPLIYDVGGGSFYQGIFLTVSEDNGETWDVFNNTTWVSYHPDVFFCEWNNYEGPKYNGNEPIEPDWDNIDILMGPQSDNAYPTMSLNVSNNKLAVQWFSQYNPFPNTADNGMQDDPVNVYTLVAPLYAFPSYSNLKDIWQGKWEPVNGIAINPKPTINTQIYPNPTTDGIVNVRVDTDSPYTLTVTNIMGQVVQTIQAKQNTVQLNVANYAPGIYIVNVKTKTATTSHKLIVK